MAYYSIIYDIHVENMYLTNKNVDVVGRNSNNESSTMKTDLPKIAIFINDAKPCLVGGLEHCFFSIQLGMS